MEKRANIQRWLLCAAVAAAALAATPVAQAARFGFADDAGKYADDGGVAFFSDLKAAGGTENRITVHWDPDRPSAILEKPFLDRSLSVAEAKGIRVVLHVFPLSPTALSAADSAEGFAAFLSKLATEYPQVREYVVGNEPNQPRFLRPQFSPAGKGLAAATYVNLLARSYDALKAVDPAIRVIGLGLSGRGNDLPLAPSNASTSPVRFLRDLGAAYRASGRTLPLMDELGLHLYPRSDRDPVRAGDRWPRAGIVNLPRIKQAVWDAFAGTGQPTVEQGLKLRIDEIGWQAVVPAGRRGRLPRPRDGGGHERARAGRQLREGDRDRRLRSQHLGRLPPPPARRSGSRAVSVRDPACRRFGSAGLRRGADGCSAREARLRRQAGELASRVAGRRAVAHGSASERASPRGCARAGASTSPPPKRSPTSRRSSPRPPASGSGASPHRGRPAR